MSKQENLQKAHEINMKLLLEIERVCKKYGLTYYLICGGLIGAARHEDFIPWDDDVDVAMTRRDYQKLKKIARKEWANGDFKFVRYDQMGNGAFLDFFSRLVYMKESVPCRTFMKIRGKGRTDIDNHIPLDIYVLDNADDNEKRFHRRFEIIAGLYGLAMGHRSYIDYSEYADHPDITRKRVKVLSTIGRHLPLKLILWAYELVCCSCELHPHSENYFTSNGYIFCIQQRLKKVWFGKGTPLPIHGHMFNAPQGYKEYLTFFYGDYMRLPPEEKRTPDHVLD